MSKFKVGDTVEVVFAGYGYGDEHVSKITKITDVKTRGVKDLYATDINPKYCEIWEEAFELVEREYPNEPHPHCDLIIEWAKGADIEFLKPSNGEWAFISEPSWTPVDCYRVKPSNPKSDKISEIESEMRRLADELKELKESR